MAETVTFDTSKNDLSAVLAAGVALAGVRTLPGFAPFTVVPQGCTVEKLDRIAELPRPEHIVSNPKFQDPQSLIDYVKRYKSESTVIFADKVNQSIVAVLDYHDQGETPGASKARYGSHSAAFSPIQSEEWKTWIGNDGQKMDQLAFGQFIEDNAPDVQKPTGADLMAIVFNLAGTSNASFKSAVRTSDGAVNLAFVDEKSATAGDGIIIPGEFGILLRPFLGCTAVDLTARFRYRASAAGISLWYDLLRPEQVARDAFDAIVAQLSSCEVPVLSGARS